MCRWSWFKNKTKTQTNRKNKQNLKQYLQFFSRNIFAKGERWWRKRKTSDMTVYPHQLIWLNSLWRKKVNSIHFHPYPQIKHLWWVFVYASWGHDLYGSDSLFVGGSKRQVFRSKESNFLRQNNSPNQSFCIYNVPPSFLPLFFFLLLKYDLCLCVQPGTLWADVVLPFRLKSPDTKAYTSFKKELR